MTGNEHVSIRRIAAPAPYDHIVAFAGALTRSEVPVLRAQLLAGLADARSVLVGVLDVSDVDLAGLLLLASMERWIGERSGTVHYSEFSASLADAYRLLGWSLPGLVVPWPPPPVPSADCCTASDGPDTPPDTLTNRTYPAREQDADG